MEGKGKGVDTASKKKRRLLSSGVSILPAGTSRSERPPTAPRPTRSAGEVTVSMVGSDPPAAIPLERPSTDRPLEPVISLDPEDSGREGPPTYYANPQVVGYDPTQSPITPENGVEFLCSYGKNMLRSHESNVFGKMSTVDRIRQSTGNIWQVAYPIIRSLSFLILPVTDILGYVLGTRESS